MAAGTETPAALAAPPGVRRRRSRLLLVALLLVGASGAASVLVLRRRGARPGEQDGPDRPAVPELPDPWADAPRDQRSAAGEEQGAPAAAPLPGRPRLVAVAGGSLPHGSSTRPPEVELRRGRQVVGRGHDSDIRLAEPTVSPRHVLLEAEEDGSVVLRDLGSLNGTTVDGVPAARVELTDGNRIALGSAQLVFHTDPAGDDGGRQGGEKGEDGVGEGPPV